MADLEKIKIGEKENLRTIAPKINAAIDAADKASTDSTEAKTTAESAEQKADSVQTQFNQVVIDGDSSVEAAQARVDGAGNEYPTLKARLDQEHNGVTAQLAQTSKRAVSTVAHDLEKDVMVAFIDDDGNKKVMSILKPIFDEMGIKGSFAIITDWVKENRPETVSESDLITLRDEGHTICNHTAGHAYLGQISLTENEREITQAKDYLNSLGCDGDILVYPYGSFNNDTLRMARKHTVIGVTTGGYGDYNTMPIDTYRMGRPPVISADTFDLEGAKTLVDNAPNGSVLLFYTHVNYDMWLLPETQQKMKDLIAYIQSKSGYKIGTLRDVFEQKANIIDTTNSEKQIFKVGRDASVIINEFRYTSSFNSNLPIDDYPYGESKVYLNNAATSTAGFGSTACTVRTYRPASRQFADSDWGAYQTREPVTSNYIYKRRWNYSSKTWTEWEVVAQPEKTLKTHQVTTTTNTYSAANVPTDFPTSVITSFIFDSQGNTGFPLSAGICTVYNFHATDWTKQEVRGYKNNQIYSRYWEGTTWSAWELIGQPIV